MSPEELCSRITEKTILVGNGGEVYGDIFRDRLGARVLFAPPEVSFPRASNVVRLSLPALRKGETLDLFGFTPIYVRRYRGRDSLGPKNASQSFIRGWITKAKPL